MENKKIEDMSTIEIKAMLFDIENEIKVKQHQYQQIGQILQNKINQSVEPTEVKEEE